MNNILNSFQQKALDYVLSKKSQDLYQILGTNSQLFRLTLPGSQNIEQDFYSMIDELSKLNAESISEKQMVAENNVSNSVEFFSGYTSITISNIEDYIKNFNLDDIPLSIDGTYLKKLSGTILVDLKEIIDLEEIAKLVAYYTFFTFYSAEWYKVITDTFEQSDLTASASLAFLIEKNNLGNINGNETIIDVVDSLYKQLYQKEFEFGNSEVEKIISAIMGDTKYVSVPGIEKYYESLTDFIPCALSKDHKHEHKYTVSYAQTKLTIYEHKIISKEKVRYKTNHDNLKCYSVESILKSQAVKIGSYNKYIEWYHSLPDYFTTRDTEKKYQKKYLGFMNVYSTQNENYKNPLDLIADKTLLKLLLRKNEGDYAYFSVDLFLKFRNDLENLNDNWDSKYPLVYKEKENQRYKKQKFNDLKSLFSEKTELKEFHIIVLKDILTNLLIFSETYNDFLDLIKLFEIDNLSALTSDK